jgi:hypothetical protein
MRNRIQLLTLMRMQIWIRIQGIWILQFDENPDPSFQVKYQDLEKGAQIDSYSIHFGLSSAKRCESGSSYHFDADADLDPDPAFHNADADMDPDPAYHFDADDRHHGRTNPLSKDNEENRELPHKTVILMWIRDILARLRKRGIHATDEWI